MFPIPNQMGMWPNFRSPLLWDVFAVSVYGTVSVLFWYVGLIPDLAMMRDRAKTRARKFAYGIFALGWRGSVRQWHHYETAYLILAALATPLVLSVHSVVSMDFAVSVLPGWHTTDLPALLRRRRDLLRVRHGADAHGDLPQGVPPRAHHHAPALRLHGEDHARHGVDGRLRLCHGVLHRLVQREPLRAVHVHEPRARTVRLGLLDHDLLQRDQPSDLLVQEGADEHPDPVRSVDRHQYRHVVRAVCDHRDVAAPRLPAVGVGLLHSHGLGRVVPARELRTLLHDVLPVRALSSDGGDRRGQDRPAAGRSALAPGLEREIKRHRAARRPAGTPEPAPEGAS